MPTPPTPPRSKAPARAGAPRTPPGPVPATLTQLLQGVKARADASGVFGETAIEGPRLACAAKASAEPAGYNIELAEGKLWVSLTTLNRWLSQSIEADLVHTGDKLEELIEEELVDQDFLKGRLPCQHFRSEDLKFTFRSPLPIAVDERGVLGPIGAAVDDAAKALLAYEACFRRLGDMEEKED